VEVGQASSLSAFDSHARGLGASHGESVRLLLARLAWLELTPVVLARALETITMKKEYVFSKAERGRFYRKGAKLRLPIYLDAKLLDQVEDLANRTGRDVGDVVNRIVEKGVRLKASKGRVRLAAFRNRRGERVEAASVTATNAKKEFGRVLETVMQGGMVVITKHDAPKAVLISVDEFDALAQASQAKLDTLSKQFDALLARMQTPKARAGMKAAFDASPKQLGRAALAVARRRG